jgi:hypothetical protein
MELMEVYHEATATWIIVRVTSGKCEGGPVCLRPDRIGHPKRSDGNSSHTGPGIGHGPYGFRSTALLLSAARNYLGPVCVLGNFILSSLVMSPRKKHARKDYSADQTKGFIMCNLEKRAYPTASRLSSSTSNQYVQSMAAVRTVSRDRHDRYPLRPSRVTFSTSLRVT